MMMNSKLLYAICGAAVVATQGCSANGGRSNEGVGGASKRNVIAEVVLSDTHRVEFLEPQPGALLVSETGAIGVDNESSVGDFASAADLYRQLVPNADQAKVAELRAADERAQAQNRAALAAPTPEKLNGSDNAVVLERKHDSFLFGPQCKVTSFEGQYSCVQDRWNQITSSDTGWQQCTSRFRSTVFQHQYTSNDAPADHRVFYWGTRGNFWDQVADTWVQPNTWQSWYSTYMYVEVTTDQVWGQANSSDHDQCVLEQYTSCPNTDLVAYVCP